MSLPPLEKLVWPTAGTRITVENATPSVPDDPIVVLLKGDGSARTINGILGLTDSALQMIDTAVSVAYQHQRKIHWFRAYAGVEARELYHPQITAAEFDAMSPAQQQEIYLPKDTLKAIEHFGVAMKGPLGTPTGGGFKSINVTLRQTFDLFSCVRPVSYFPGAPSPNLHVLKDGMDVVIFRENTEDVYAGIEFAPGSDGARRIQNLLVELGTPLKEGWHYGIGIKPISQEGSTRLAKSAMQYAISHGYKTLTVMAKGNIMKQTEGKFKEWAYEVRKEFGDTFVTEEELWDVHQGVLPSKKILLNYRIADNMFQKIQQEPHKFGVIACPNLNGDYLSDAAATEVGGLGIAPGANIGDKYAIFEATHGTADDLAGKDLANPSSIALSGEMMLRWFGWNEAADLLKGSIARQVAIAGKMAQEGKKPLPLTGDLVNEYPHYTRKDGIRCSEYVAQVLERMKELSGVNV